MTEKKKKQYKFNCTESPSKAQDSLKKELRKRTHSPSGRQGCAQPRASLAGAYGKLFRAKTHQTTLGESKEAGGHDVRQRTKED